MLTSTVKAIPSSRTTSSIVIAPNAKSQTFLFADPAGYTALTEAHGDEAAAASCSAIRRIVPDYAAEEIKSIGDALMIRVSDAGDAVALAVRVINETASGTARSRVASQCTWARRSTATATGSAPPSTSLGA